MGPSGGNSGVFGGIGRILRELGQFGPIRANSGRGPGRRGGRARGLRAPQGASGVGLNGQALPARVEKYFWRAF